MISIGSERRLNTVDELIHYLNSFGTEWIFRGHRSSSWRLESTLERCLGAHWSAEKADRAETAAVQMFTTKAHLYLTRDSSPDPDSKLGWLSLMQHHGVPTRLLDFTLSPYVALYFAIADGYPDSGNDYAIWAINYRRIMDASIAKLTNIDRKFNWTNERVQLDPDTAYNDIAERYSAPILWITEPKRMNVRLERQAGTFLLPTKPGAKLEEFAQDADYEFQKNVEKLVFPRPLRDNLYAFLEKARINAANLFFDIDGLAKDIRRKLEFYHT